MKKIKIIYFFISLKIIFTSCDAAPDKSKLSNEDYRLFWNTPVWDLVKAVRSEDIGGIKRIIENHKNDIDYQEERFGYTILMLTILNHDYTSCKTLLELGANPNKYDKFSGSSAIIKAAGLKDDIGDNTRFLKLLLAYGANVNDEEIGERREGNTTRKTPLLAACSGDKTKEKVKILVEAGANVNYKNEFNIFPLQEALLLEQYDVALYLLQKGANYNEIIIDRGEYTKGGEKIYITDYLKEHLLQANSEKHKQMTMILEFLKQKAIN